MLPSDAFLQHGPLITAWLLNSRAEDQGLIWFGTATMQAASEGKNQILQNCLGERRLLAASAALQKEELGEGGEHLRKDGSVPSEETRSEDKNQPSVRT